MNNARKSEKLEQIPHVIDLLVENGLISEERDHNGVLVYQISRKGQELVDQLPPDGLIRGISSNSPLKK